MKGDEGERGDEKKKGEKKSGQRWPLKRDRTRNGEQGCAVGIASRRRRRKKEERWRRKQK